MEPTRLGSTLLVNAETADLQTTFEDALQAIAIDGSGNFVVVFTGQDTAGQGVFLRRFDSNGQAIDLAGNPSNVDRLVNNAAAPGNQLKPAISMNSRGEFVVAWTSSSGQDGSLSGVYARLYYLDQNNVLQPGAQEIRINDATLLEQFEPSVAINNQGWFVSSYSSFSLDEDPDTFDPYRFDIFIRAYTYNNQGEIQQTAEIPVNLTRLGDQRNSSIAMNDQGDIVVVWTGPDGSGNGIYYRRFKLQVSGSTPQLVPVGDTTRPDTLVNTTTTGVQGAPHVAIDNAGNFVVTWTSTDPINTGDDVFVRRFFYDSNNQLQADEPKLVNVTTSLNQRNSRVAFLPDGGFVVTWTGSSPTTGEDIYSRRFNRLGNPMGTEDYLVNRGTAYTLDNQANAAIATGSDGNYVIVWSGSGPDDSDGGVYAQRFGLAPNRAPNGLSLSNTLVREDAGTGAVVGDLSTTDPDGDLDFIYELVGNDLDNASFVIVNNQLRFKDTVVLDFETRSSYSVRVRTTDLGGLSFEQTFTIEIVNVNEAPTALNLSGSLEVEDGATGDALIIGTISAVDVDDLPRDLTFSLIPGFGNNSAFTIVNSNELRLISSPNYSTNQSFLVGLRVTDSAGNQLDRSFTITVLDRNLPSSRIDLSNTTVAENTLEVGILSTVDPDSNAVFTYELVPIAGSTDDQAFEIVGNQLRFKADQAPDFETKTSYTIEVRSSDRGDTPITQRFTITITDVNEPPTDLIFTRNPNSLNENTTDLVAGTLSTVDPDQNNSFTYSLVPIAGSTDDQAFEIVGNQLRFRSSPDFEAQDAYTVRIRSNDGVNTIERDFTITVQDVNEAPTNIILSNNQIDENATDLLVGSFSTLDPDRGDSFTYELLQTGDFAAFSLNSQGELRLNNAPNFEVKNSYTIQVRSRDQGGLTTTKAFTIAVNDINETPLDLTLDDTSIEENTRAGDTIGRFSTDDPDLNDTFTYELVAGEGDTDNNRFRIVSNQLQIQEDIDPVNRPSYSIRVRVRDGGNNTIERIFTLNVDVVNDPPTAISLSNQAIAENATNLLVGTFSTTDPDSTNFVYTLVPIAGSTDDQAFEIVGNQLRFRTAPDFEAQDSYTIEVRSSDGDNAITQRFTITVIDVNEPPTDLIFTRNPNSLNENTTDLVAGTLSTVDPDQNNSFTYSLVPIAGSTDDQAFEIVGNQLRFRSSPDFEQKNSYTVEIRSFDGSNAITRLFTIIVNDVNEAPTNLQLTGTSVNEGAAIGTEVGTFSAVDPDAGDTISYSLVPNSLPDNAAFSIEGNRLLLQVVPSLSDRTSYTIRVQASDRNNLSTIRDFTIAVQDVENAPTAITLSRESIDENAGENALVGLLSTTDADANEQFIYTLISIPGVNDSDAFSLTNVNELRLRQSANFEQKSSYTVRIRTTDRTNRSFEQDFVIAVNDLNEAPTNLTLSNLELDENSAANTVVGILTVTDPDAGDVITYTLPDGGLNDNSVFSIVNTNQLRLNVSPNYEQKASYTVRVVATDRGGLATERTFTIAINDLNEAPTGVNLSNTTVSAIAPANSVVGILSTVDPDAVDTFTYQLVGGLPDNSAFAINGTELRLISPPNPALQSSYTIRIQTTDQGNLTFEQDFTITVVQANRPPVGLSLDNSSISEDATVGTTIGTFTTNDPDMGDSFTYRLVFGFGDSGNTFFTIVGNELRLAQPLDFETRSIHSIRVRTTDQAGASLDQIFNITVLDGNDAPTDLRFSETSIPENLAADSVVGSFSSIDPNPGDTFTYSLVEGAGATDNGIFRIDNGQLRILSSPDFETKSSYSIRVRTVDQGGLSFERSLTLTVTDINEAPSDLTLNGNTVLENLPTNTFVGSFATTDPDLGDTFTYTLVPIDGSTDHTAFTIVGNQLRTAAVFDFEAKSSYQIRVRTTDRSGLSLERDFAIAVQDVNDTPPPTSTIPVIDLNGSAEGINSTASGILGLPIPLVGSAATLTGTSGFQVTSFAVVISNVRDGSAEILAANTAGTPILAAYSADSGTLLLTGTAPLETYLQVLRTVTYQNVALVPNPTPRQILFFANDGANNSAIATTTLSFLPANTINGTPGNDQVAATTLEFDLVRLHAGDDILFSLTQHLLQQDYIDGGSGIDTLTLIAGTGHVTVNVDSNSQVGGVLAGTTVINFERFNFSQFAGTATMTGSNNPTVRDYLAGGSGDDTLFGLAGDDELVGNGGNDLLVGGLGSDRMIGGLGNDTYDVDSPSDVIVEQLNQGIDTVRSAIDYTLGANLENLVLLNGAVVGRGNNLANTLIGNAANNTLAGNAGRDRLFGEAGDDRLLGGRGADRLDGGQGNDVLTGGLGQDSFVLSAAPGAGSDRITDFDPTQDRILFSRTGFETFIRTGRLQANQFRLGSRASDGDDRLIYNRSTGALFFDPDGNGSIAPIQIAVLQNRAALSAANFIVI
ncbi:MAG TPA: cadherin domain-containing protein [Synechococcales cyanobacterium M55_K2018_004]|nr:cadherin domain-containing protein [Synechococcales cyanobacterium M55_K2018_004]